MNIKRKLDDTSLFPVNQKYLTPSRWNGMSVEARVWSMWERSASGMCRSSAWPRTASWKADSTALGRGSTSMSDCRGVSFWSEFRAEVIIVSNCSWCSKKVEVTQQDQN